MNLIKLFSFPVVVWSLWTTRNKMSIEGVYLHRPTGIFCKILNCLQRWRARLKCTDLTDKVELAGARVGGRIQGENEGPAAGR
jgi:hypothetical protein